MKLKYTLAGLALVTASCTKESTNADQSTIDETVATLTTATNEKSAGATSSNQFAVHKNLTTGLKYVDTDGEFLVLSDSSEDMRLLIQGLDEFEKMARAEKGGKKIPAQFHFSDILTKTKLSSHKATTASAKKEYGAWTNKSFLDLNGETEGVFSLFKGRAGQWGAYEFAPSGSDMVVELDINIVDLANLLEENIALLEPKMRSEAEREYRKARKGMGEFEFLLNGVHPRVSIVSKLNRDSQIEAEGGVEFPDVNLVARVQGLGKVFDKVEHFLGAELKKEEKNGLVYYRAPQELLVPGNAKAMTPVIVADKANDSIWICSRESFLEECMSGDTKLKDDADFKKLMGGLSDSGNLFAYVSQDSMKLMKELYDGKVGDYLKQGAKSDVTRSADLKLIDALFAKIVSPTVKSLAEAEGGYAVTMDLNDDGLLISSRSPFAMKGNNAVQSVAVVAGLSAISSPIIIRQIARARATTALNNGKDIYVSLRDYAIKNGGETPGSQESIQSANKHLRELFKTGACRDESPFFVKGVKNSFVSDGDIFGAEALSSGENSFGYVPGVNLFRDPANTPVLITPLVVEDGKVSIDINAFGKQVVIVCSDGSALVLPVSEEGEILVYGSSRRSREYSFSNGVISFRNGRKMKSYKVALPE